MPGPPLSKTFTYNGTPNPQHKKRGDKPNTLAREVVQSNRFFLSDDTGTHARTPYRHNIPQNSGKGIGSGTNEFTTATPQID